MTWVRSLARHLLTYICALDITDFALLPDFSDADVEAASVHFRAAASTPALENWIDWILSHPQSAPACAAGLTKSVAGAAVHAHREFPTLMSLQ